MCWKYTYRSRYGDLDEQMSENTGMVVMAYALSDVDVRRTAVEFRRCFSQGQLWADVYEPVDLYYLLLTCTKNLLVSHCAIKFPERCARDTERTC